MEKNSKLKGMCQKTLQSLRYALKNWKYDWGNLFIIVIPVLFAIPFTYSLITFSWIGSVIAIILLLLGWLQTNYHKDNIKQKRRDYIRVKDERDHLNNSMISIPYDIIRRLFKYWKLGYNERITIYRYDEEGFIPVARYAKRPELKQRGREVYPKNEGYINFAWIRGECSVHNLPSFKENKEEYLEKVNKESNMTKKDLKGLTMQSRAYFCKTLTDDLDNSIGIIVIESLDTTIPVNDEQFSAELNGFYGKILVSVIEPNLPPGKGNINE